MISHFDSPRRGRAIICSRMRSRPPCSWARWTPSSSSRTPWWVSGRHDFFLLFFGACLTSFGVQQNLADVAGANDGMHSRCANWGQREGKKRDSSCLCLVSSSSKVFHKFLIWAVQLHFSPYWFTEMCSHRGCTSAAWSETGWTSATCSASACVAQPQWWVMVHMWGEVKNPPQGVFTLPHRVCLHFPYRWAKLKYDSSGERKTRVTRL